MDAFQRLIDQGYWGLELPLIVRDTEISAASLSANPRGCYDGPQPGTRNLSLEIPLLRGLDVRMIQLALSDLGMDIKADGIYGQTSVRLMKAYQQNNGLPVTGAADITLIARLCLKYAQ
jgi:chitosanase